MTQVDVTYENGSERHYLAVGDPDTVWQQTSKLHVKRLEVHSADDLSWPERDECPVLA